MKKPIILVALLVVVGLGGFLVYDDMFSSEADEEFTLDSATTDSTAGSGGDDNAGGDNAAADLAKLSGTWTVGPTSEAGYRIVEDTPTGETTVTGRTDTVDGSVTLSDGELTATQVAVDLASVASDQPLRDTAFRDTIMKTSEFPKATFRQTDAVAIPGSPSATEPTSVEVAGTLDLRGADQPAIATIDAVADGDTITVVGKIEVQLADFGIDPPEDPRPGHGARLRHHRIQAGAHEELTGRVPTHDDRTKSMPNVSSTITFCMDYGRRPGPMSHETRVLATSIARGVCGHGPAHVPRHGGIHHRRA